MSVTVAVIGSGMMGRGIAAVMAAAGVREVRLHGRTIESANAGAVKAEELAEFLDTNGLVRGSRSPVQTTASLSEAVKGADFVFESIVEDLEAKQVLMSELEALVGPSTVICTNTSSLSVTEIFSKLGQDVAARSMAAHFIGPAHLVPLVELCPTPHTGPGVVARTQEFLQTVGKKPIVMKKEIPGFIAARLQAALYRECMHLVLEGCADPAAIDEAVHNGFGRRLNQIGPFQQADLAGVDLVQGTHARFFPQLGNYQRDLLADQLVSEGRKGMKVGKGHHEWSEERTKDVVGRRDGELLRRLKEDFSRL